MRATNCVVLVPPVSVVFATPRKLPKVSAVGQRVVVVDVAFASEASSGGFAKITKPFIDGLGPRLLSWVDHHDHAMHSLYANDPRFLLRRKSQHGACPEMVTEELVARVGRVDTIVCHTDFDGLCTAAKWILGGREPYPTSDDDARRIDTRTGHPGPIGELLDRAIRARPRDERVLRAVLAYLVSGCTDRDARDLIELAADELAPLEREAAKLSGGYRVLLANGHCGVHSLAFLDTTGHSPGYDKTWLLLAGQDKAEAVLHRDGDTVTLAARFDSGIDFLRALGLSGGMPTLVSLSASRLAEIRELFGVTLPRA